MSCDKIQPAQGWIKQIAQVVHGATAESRFLVMTVHKSYMDETGIGKNDRYCTIAGYVGKAKEWEWLDQDWRFILGQYMGNLPPAKRYFHALEFYGRDEKYHGWSKTKRRSFFTALCKVVNDYNLVLFSGTVDSQAFFSLTEDERRYLTGGYFNGFKWTKSGAPQTPYYVPFYFGVIHPAVYVPEGDKLFLIMSKQDQYENNALRLYDDVLDTYPVPKCRSKLAEDMVFSNPREVPALQAADLATYWLGKMMTYRAKTGDRKLTNFPHLYEISMIMKNVRSWEDLKLFDISGLLLLLTGCDRHIKTSFVMLDQTLPSLPAEEQRRILGIMRKANFRGFLDRWQPSDQAVRDCIDACPCRYSGNPIRRWIARPSQSATE